MSQDADYVRIGFTGTRVGMTPAQRTTVEELLDLERVQEVHHGDCVGADADFHGICVGRYPVVIHPPAEPKLRAWCGDAEVLPSKEYLARNRDIVDQTDELIATPKGDRWENRGGTWSTIDYARKQGKFVSIVWPNGGVTGYHPPIDLRQTGGGEGGS